MSDSDDTDVLLLIPPDYFVEHGLEEHFKRQQALQLQATEVLNATISHILEQNELDDHINTSSVSTTASQPMDGGADAEKVPPPTAAYQFLPPNRKAELNHINTRLYEIETNQRDSDNDAPLQHHHEHQQQHYFEAPSDISTISNNTVRTQLGGHKQHLPPTTPHHHHYNNNNNNHHHHQHSQSKQQHRNGLVHSTPKQQPPPQPQPPYGSGNADDCRAYRDDGLLLEIDHFLEGGSGPACGDATGKWHRHQQRYYDEPDCRLEGRGRCDSLPAIDRLSMESMPPMSMVTTHKPDAKGTPPDGRSGSATNLISLSEIWGKSGQGTTIAAHGIPHSTLKEEQLRRQHLEKTVHQLQSRLLEYQQRLSVAIEVDRAKDAAIAKAQTEAKDLQADLQHSRETVRSLEADQREHHGRMDELQKELAQAVSLATKFQEKNEKLETELNVCSRKTSECSNKYKQQVEELEMKLHAAKRSEDYAVNELTRTKDKQVKAEYQADKLKVRSDELEKECSTLRHQKEMLQEYHQKQKQRADSLESQKKSLHESLAHLTDTEASLKKKLELQQKTLKSHYQQQLENVVAQKMKEFQEQLDKTEEHLRAEARDRERLIAERAVKQLELINEKNEVELQLMQEKHNEEVALYRIQLANASKRIDDLELKLNCYKSKRADIAEKLHDVMEKQWQQALEILTSPNQSNRMPPTDDECGGHASPDDNDDNNAGPFADTPKSSKAKGLTVKENNLNNVRSSHSKAGMAGDQTPAPFDRLQAYIELLLSKSPSDFDKLDQILALSSKAKTTAGKLDRTAAMKRLNSCKPPWKA